ncbi:hypothetical protein AVT69_gp364 [Pseudomonas phage PhiPA3]|uniref:Uncharacterized protein 372 n=1 Tax=Pseudomonas phage PhiPA3 TaxID=998086 RepID=F8SJK4_BPPA3|nr:hypothetical protein AVT69_gp364 [Pseudomonas phage PhiPA3]AEH03795.1 hypothetical protein [Pseudomonas phage PhiPA3]
MNDNIIDFEAYRNKNNGKRKMKKIKNGVFKAIDETLDDRVIEKVRDVTICAAVVGIVWYCLTRD